MKKPNILFFFSDQQRWDTVGCYGQQLNLTPNLDRMAAEGILFRNAFTCQPVCGPARAALQTGKYPTETGCFTNHRMLPEDETTIAHRLSDSGYRVGYIGKWHLASFGPFDGKDDFRIRPVPPERRGGYKDFWLASDTLESTSHSYDGYMFNGDMERVDFPDGRYRADAQTDWVIDYLNAYDRDDPFFLFVSYIEPHHQNDHKHYEGPHGSKEKYKNFTVPGDLAETEGDWREEYPDYLGCVNSLDTNLGRILDTLEAKGILEDTIVIYTSDHGSHFRTRNREYKRSCHEGCVRIPMVIRGPGFTGGKEVQDLASLIDLPPTILESAGVQPPESMKGNSLNRLAKGDNANWPQEVFIQISESQVGRAIRTDRWKYSVTAPEKDARNDAASDRYVEDFLYDLNEDPHEKNNLVRDPAYALVRADLAERLRRHMAHAGEPMPEILLAVSEQ